MRIVALNGSHRRGGVIDTAVTQLLAAAARASGAATEKIDLIDRRIEFCGNCRACCLAPGAGRGRCVIEDDAAAVLDSLESADAIVLAAPVNFGDVNARTRQLLERMVGYAYWPWDHAAPKLRRESHQGGGATSRKPAVLLTSSAAPGLITRMFAQPLRTLRRMAKLLGATPVGSLVIGRVATEQWECDPGTRRKLERLAHRLVRRAAATS